MSDYRRNLLPGGTFFLTVVTYDRRPILTEGLGRTKLSNAIKKIREKRPFELVATVLLPDHWHLLMSLPSDDDKYSLRMKQIKEEFTREWLGGGGIEAEVTASQRLRGDRGVWQPRFWEHTVKDEDDLEACVDYIHWNPVKHGLVENVCDWPWSSFHRFVRGGQYDINWGQTAPKTIRKKIAEDWGEALT